jgi:hypothetical protein
VVEDSLLVVYGAAKILVKISDVSEENIAFLI